MNRRALGKPIWRHGYGGPCRRDLLLREVRIHRQGRFACDTRQARPSGPTGRQRGAGRAGERAARLAPEPRDSRSRGRPLAFGRSGRFRPIRADLRGRKTPGSRGERLAAERADKVEDTRSKDGSSIPGVECAGEGQETVEAPYPEQAYMCPARATGAKTYRAERLLREAFKNRAAAECPGIADAAWANRARSRVSARRAVYYSSAPRIRAPPGHSPSCSSNDSVGQPLERQRPAPPRAGKQRSGSGNPW